jgi:hypothetical protein
MLILSSYPYQLAYSNKENAAEIIDYVIRQFIGADDAPTSHQSVIDFNRSQFLRKHFKNLSQIKQQ